MVSCSVQNYKELNSMHAQKHVAQATQRYVKCVASCKYKLYLILCMFIDYEHKACMYTAKTLGLL